jgi:two-component system aerobic respiration control sensor histidine kinase ArcB
MAAELPAAGGCSAGEAFVASGFSKRVLYVDGNEINLRVVAALMEALGGVVSCCSSPQQALDLLEREAFDIAFTDMHMPEMTGFDVLREVRQRPGPNSTAPVVALTADLTRTRAQYRALGFDGFIPKPVALRPLAEMLLQCLPLKRCASAA